MKFKIEAQCPGCKLGSDVIVRKPTLMKPVVKNVECENCGSGLMVKVSLDRRVLPKDGQYPLGISVAIHTESETLKQLRREEKEYREGARVLGSPQ